MKLIRHSGALCNSVLIAACCLSFASNASADVIEDEYISDTDFHYWILHMPDLDQRRTALPGGGSMYCVPTSVMNLMVYIANHGFPNQGPGPGNYQSQILFDYTTAMLSIMGSANFMNTSTSGGTTGSGLENGVEAWLNDDWFTWDYYYAVGGWAPRQHNLTASATLGSLVAYCFGRYDIIGFNGPVPIVSRDGGHCITLARSFANGTDRWTWVRDPGRDNGDPNVQSLFANTLHNISATVVQIGNGGPLRVMDTIGWPQNDNRHRLIDSYLKIKPKAGYSFTDTGVILMNPFVFPGGQSLVNYNTTHDNGVMNDIAIGPDDVMIWSVQTNPDGAPRLYKFNRLHNTSSLIPDVPQPKAIVFGRKRGLYVLTANSIQHLDVDRDPPVVVGAASLTFPSDAIAYDDHFDQVVLLSVGARDITRYDESLVGPPQRFVIPMAIPLAGRAQIVIDPTDQSMWFRTDGANKIFRATIVPTVNGPGINVEEIAIVVKDVIVSFDIDSAGKLFMIDGDELREFRRNPTTGDYDEVDSAYSDFPLGRGFKIARNRTNRDPILHEGPEWRHIDPVEFFDTPSFGDCFADIAPSPVADLSVGVPDLLAVINSWGPCADPADCPADIAPMPGGDGHVGVPDLLAVINNWGPCP